MEEFFPSLHWTHLLIIPGLLIGFTVHELGHALTAYFLGDYSQIERGKITLSPWSHISWVGAICFFIFGFGWPKPLQVNPYNLKRKYLDVFLIAISGPIASFMLGLVSLLLTLVLAAALVHLSGASTDHVFSFFFPSVFPFLFPILIDLPQSLDWQLVSISLTGYIAAISFWMMVISLLPFPGMDGFAAFINLIAHFQERGRKAVPSPRQAPVLSIDKPITLAGQRKRRNSAATIHFEAGAEYHEEKKYEDAIARYRQAINNDQNFGPAYINMGLAYLAKGDRKKAIQAFRGSTQYADDQRSQTEAWQQLQQLSYVNPLNETEAQESMVEIGASPWTDTKPRPNWLGLGIGGLLLLLTGLFMYSYLLVRLIDLVRI